MQCMRGFSYMPQKLLEPTELKLVETEDLDRNWRVTRRERLKEQEKKIYEEFVQEKDVVYSVLEDDRYQFIYELPETCLRELMETKPKASLKDEESSDTQDTNTDTETTDTEGQIDSPLGVHFEEQDDNNDIFHIYDDDVSADEQEPCESVNGSMCTVREKDSETDLNDGERDAKQEAASCNIIENSIYCAKVKDLRQKINTELMETCMELESMEVKEMDTEPLKKMLKCANEFCARFNRVHMYQMKRQIGDIERHNSLTLPFARHTQFQSQMVRIISLHQNLLHSLQVFRKSLPQTMCLRECAAALRALAHVASDVTRRAAAADIYRDEIPETTLKLEQVLDELTPRLAAMVAAHNLDDPSTIRSSGTKTSLVGRDKKKMDAKTKRAEVESRLSMYSLEVRRQPSKSHVVVNTTATESKQPAAPAKEKKDETKEKKLKETKVAAPVKRTVLSRRPLMRDPNTKKAPKLKVMERESEIKTMVENFDAASSLISREESPYSSTDLKIRPQRTSHGWIRKNTTPVAAKNLNRQTSLRVTRPIERTPRSVSPKSSPKRREKKLYQAVNKILSPLIGDAESAKIAHVQRIKVKLTPRERGVNEEAAGSCPDLVSELGDNFSSKTTAAVEKERTSTIGKEERKAEVAAMEVKNRGDEVSGTDLQPSGDQRDVSQLLRRLCCGDATGPRREGIADRVSGSRNAQLVCITSTAAATPRPQQPSTTELLRILEENIQKTPREFARATPTKDIADKLRLAFNIPERVTNNMFQYRTKYVQHMLTSPMYANSIVGKPWEVVSRVSEDIIEELLLRCVRDMEIQKIIRDIYLSEML